MLKKSAKKKGERSLKDSYIPKKKLKKRERSIEVTPLKLEEKPQRSFFNGRRVFLWFLWVVFFGELVYLIFFSQFFVLDKVIVKNESEVKNIQDIGIENFLKGQLSGKWLGAVSKNNIFLVDPKTLEEQVRLRYPKLAAVEIHKELPGTLIASVTEKKYQLLWCQKEECFLVDENGKTSEAKIFFEYLEEQGRYFRIQDDATEKERAEIGQLILQSEEKEFYNKLFESFPNKGIDISNTIERPSVYSSEIRLKTSRGFEIWLSTALPIEDTLENLFLMLEKEVPENEWDKIQYIDLRTEGRIYYTRSDKIPESDAKSEEEQKKESQEEQKSQE